MGSEEGEEEGGREWAPGLYQINLTLQFMEIPSSLATSQLYAFFSPSLDIFSSSQPTDLSIKVVPQGENKCNII